MKKLIDFRKEGLVKTIQAYADKHCEGNFSQAVRVLLLMSLEEEGAFK